MTPRGVLITRPAADAAATAQHITARGLIPIIAPLLEITPTPIELPASAQAILVTSGNALASLPIDPRPLLAVGDATAQRARALGFPNVLSAAGDATHLAQLATRTLPPSAGPLCLACGEGQGAALTAALSAENFQVIQRVAYIARPVTAFPETAAAALRGATLHAALFMSAQTARAFSTLLPPALVVSVGTVLAVAIGKPAADALKHLPWRQIRLASTPTLDDVLAQL
jgi:uroporphyrinogen-III synthase